MSTLEQITPGGGAASSNTELTVSVVIPCLNEADSIQQCVRRALSALQDNGYVGEVIVADNDSDDGSPLLAAEAGAPTSPGSPPPEAATS